MTDQLRALVSLLVTLTGLGGIYRHRHGKNEPHFTIHITGPAGQRIGLPQGVNVPMSALDDLILAVQEVRDRRRAEFRETGWSQQIAADHWLTHPDSFPAKPSRDDVRGWYEKSAAAAEQADGLNLLLGEE